MATIEKKQGKTKLDGIGRTDFYGMMELEYNYLYKCLGKNKDAPVNYSDLFTALHAVGIMENDPRLKLDLSDLNIASQPLEFGQFKKIIKYSLGGVNDATQ